MPNEPEPTPAEKAVAKLLRRGWANGRGQQVSIEDRAAEIVAAVRPFIEREQQHHPTVAEAYAARQSGEGQR